MSEHSSPGNGSAADKTYILWATNMDDLGYADILFLVGDEPPYGVGINCGGHVIVKPLRDWHALAAVPAQGGWQPIDTAPQDGTWVIVWETYGINTKFSPADVGRYHLGEWQNSDKTRLHNASHWMPLPASPFPSTGLCTPDWPPKFEMMKLQARPADGGDWIDIFAAQLQWMAKEGNEVRALPSPNRGADE